MRNTRQFFLALGAAALAMTPTLALAPAGAKARKTPPAAAAKAEPQNSCATCVERRPILDPLLFAKGYEPDVRASYEAAQKYPDTLDRIHCFCECKESPREHHRTLLTCFTSGHGAACGLCQHEALLAGKLKDQGASDDQVETTVESIFKTDNHPPTFGRGL